MGAKAHCSAEIIREHVGCCNADVQAGWEAGLKGRSRGSGTFSDRKPPEHLTGASLDDWLDGQKAAADYRRKWLVKSIQLVGWRGNEHVTQTRKGWSANVTELVSKMRAAGVSGSVTVCYYEGKTIVMSYEHSPDCVVKLQISRPRQPRRNEWTDREDKLISDLYGTMTIAELAVAVGRTEGACRSRVQTLGVVNRRRSWQQEEDNIVAEVWPTSGSRKTAMALVAAGYADRTDSSVANRARFLGLRSALAGARGTGKMSQQGRLLREKKGQKKTLVQVWLDGDLKHLAQARAELHNQTLAEFVRQAIRAHAGAAK